MRTRLPVSTILLTACVLALAAPFATAAPKDKLVLRTHYVADLVIPTPPVKAFPSIQETKATPSKTQESELIRMVESTISPQSWNDNGGAGTIDYHPLALSLVVNQTAAIHEQIAEMLAALRRLNDVQIALDVKIVSVPEFLTFDRIGVDFSKQGDALILEQSDARKWLQGAMASPAKPILLDDKQVFHLLTYIQGDTRSHITQTPKMTLFNGQTGVLDIRMEKYFLTGVTMKPHEQNCTVIPKNESVKLGTILTAQPMMSADQRQVKVDIKIDQKDVVTPIQQIPVVVPIFPTEVNDGVSPNPVTFTQVIQQPTFQTVNVATTVSVPDGGTVLLDGWAESSEVKTESCPPVLSKIPYLNRLFKNVACGREKQHVFVLVTPRIIINEEVKAPVAACPRCDNAAKACPACYEEAEAGTACIKPQTSMSRQSKVLAELLKAYDEACADCHEAEAEKFAKAALLIDPACFRRK